MWQVTVIYIKKKKITLSSKTTQALMPLQQQFGTWSWVAHTRDWMSFPTKGCLIKNKEKSQNGSADRF